MSSGEEATPRAGTASDEEATPRTGTATSAPSSVSSMSAISASVTTSQSTSVTPSIVDLRSAKGALVLPTATKSAIWKYFHTYQNSNCLANCDVCALQGKTTDLHIRTKPGGNLSASSLKRLSFLQNVFPFFINRPRIVSRISRLDLSTGFEVGLYSRVNLILILFSLQNVANSPLNSVPLSAIMDLIGIPARLITF
jgi:hypothetical protein